MSPQVAVISSSSHRVSLVSASDDSFLANLIEAADEAYQKTSDASSSSSSSSAQVHAGPGRKDALSIPSSSGSARPRFNLRKRKVVSVSGTSCAGSLSAVNSAFLSGLFADIQQTASTSATTASDDHEEHYVTDGESCPGTPIPSPKKRARLGRSLSRCTKSYASLSALAGSATYDSTDSYVEKISDNSKTDATATSNKANETKLPIATVASDVLTDSLTAAAALADTVFPHLPATVSDSPLRLSSLSSSAASASTSSASAASSKNLSADLMAQPASSTEASTGAGAEPTNVEPEMTLEEVFAPAAEQAGPASAAVTPTGDDSSADEESYGWFLALDNDDAAEEHITDAYDGAESTSSLAFQAPVSASAAAHDAAVEWAKAADTVDDVLGDLPF